MKRSNRANSAPANGIRPWRGGVALRQAPANCVMRDATLASAVAPAVTRVAMLAGKHRVTTH